MKICLLAAVCCSIAVIGAGSTAIAGTPVPRPCEAGWQDKPIAPAPAIAPDFVADISAIGNLTPASPYPAAPLPASCQPQHTAANLSEEALAEQFPRAADTRTNPGIRARSDGFDIAGRAFIDPEGPISDYSFNARNGEIGFRIAVDDHYRIKVMRLDQQDRPLAIAQAWQTADDWQIETVTGIRVNGDRLSIQPMGFLVTRDRSASLYVAGSGLIELSAPTGYRIADEQPGDVLATRHALIERVMPADSVITALDGLKKLITPDPEPDYALMDIYSRNLRPVNIAPRPACGSRCASSTSAGDRDDAFYSRNIRWFSTPGGPIAISLENAGADIFITQIDSGRRVDALHHDAGPGSFDAYQLADGRVTVTARWSRATAEITDAAALLDPQAQQRHEAPAATAFAPAVSSTENSMPAP